jgi:hypothetical protein
LPQEASGRSIVFPRAQAGHVSSSAYRVMAAMLQE